ncbi:MAG TPA: DDE-type integrase/transposase/recombinase [Firmicutes bacterium]|nr:DDE-type integrase/transposase/recombinase [Bacillota bacterium]
MFDENAGHILFHFIDEIFQILDGIPREIVTDNMKKVMDKVKTEYTKEKINNSFYQFSKDYHSRVHPCTARHSNTKAKVESPMKILGE